LLAAAAVVVAALALFFVPPMLLNLGGQAPASPSPSPTLASPSTSPSPTPTPVPTPLVYVVQSGDTLSKIAKQFGVSLDALIEANKDRITNPDRINIGDQIVIPTPPPEVVPGQSSPAASEAPPSPAP
jgi:LysM repeat protein